MARLASVMSGWVGRTWILLAVVAAAALALAGGRISTASAEVAEYPTETSIGWNPSGVAAGREGDLYYTGPSEIYRFAAPSENKLIKWVEPAAVSQHNWTTAIALGPDGALWFTDPWGIGRVDPSATPVSEEFLTPAAEVDPYCITAGPGGEQAMWFTEASHHAGGPGRIGRISMSGEVKEFPLPAGNSVGDNDLGCISTGPNDTIWFTEQEDNAIGVMSTSGTLLHVYSVPPSDSPVSITEGADGNMWFLGRYTSSGIGRITPSGEVTEFADPNSGTSILKGPDGNVWFTYGQYQGGVGCITPTGQIGLSPAPVGGFMNGMTVGPEGAIWFVNAAAFKLDRLYPVVCNAPAASSTSSGGGSGGGSGNPGGSSGGGSSGGGGTAGGATGTGSASGARASGTTVTVSVSCTGSGTCTFTFTLTVTVRVRFGYEQTESARRKKTKSRTVVVGNATADLAAGQTQTVRVGLNSTGKRLLAKDHTLKAQLSAVQVGAAHTTTVASTLVTFKARKRRKR